MGLYSNYRFIYLCSKITRQSISPKVYLDLLWYLPSFHEYFTIAHFRLLEERKEAGMHKYPSRMLSSFPQSDE